MASRINAWRLPAALRVYNISRDCLINTMYNTNWLRLRYCVYSGQCIVYTVLYMYVLRYTLCNTTPLLYLICIHDNEGASIPYTYW
jgi:hypothetical protein